MKKQILSACLGLAFVVGCKDKSQPAPSAGVIPSVVRTDTPVSPSVKGSVSISDAGMLETITAHPYALEHGSPCRLNHLKKARELRELGELKDTLLELRQAAFDAPDDLETLTFLADVARRTRDHSMAAVVHGERARLQPADASPLVQKARSLLSMKDVPGALEAIDEALVRDPELPEAYHVRGRAMLEAGRLAGAIEAFEETVALQPDHGYAYNNLGLAFLRSNQNEEALEVLTLAVGHLPDVAFVQNNLGVALDRLGQKEEAQEAFEKAVALSPRYVKAKVNAQRMARVASLTARPVVPPSGDSGSGQGVTPTEWEDSGDAETTPEVSPPGDVSEDET